MIKQTPEKCPVCGVKLILKGPGWGFCDNCTSEITIKKKVDKPKNV